jgi:hypothetical protein
MYVKVYVYERVCVHTHTHTYTHTHSGKEIVDLSKDSVKGIDDNEDKKKEKEEAQTDFANVCKFLVSAIGNKKISKV